jgi:DNA polymerase III subunit beta
VKFACERDTLVEALGTAGRAVSSRSGASPTLSGIKLELTGDRLALTGTDLDMTISTEVDVAGDSDGVAVLPARLAVDIVRSLEQGRIELSVTDEEAHITAGRAQFAVRALPATEFPRPPEPPDRAVTLESAAFGEALKQVVTAASHDESRPILTGVLLAAEGTGLRLVATDSYRLAVRDLPGTSVLEGDEQVLVPSSALRELSRLLGGASEVTIRVGERHVSFETGAVRLTTRLIEGEFPNYRGLIPANNPNRLTVGRDALYEGVRRVKLLAKEATPVRLAMAAESLELITINQDLGQAHEQLDAKYEGSELTVAFNPDYLTAGIEVCPGDEVTLETVDQLKPAVLRSVEREDFLYLLMPVRVSA